MLRCQNGRYRIAEYLKVLHLYSPASRERRGVVHSVDRVYDAKNLLNFLGFFWIFLDFFGFFGFFGFVKQSGFFRLRNDYDVIYEASNLGV